MVLSLKKVPPPRAGLHLIGWSVHSIVDTMGPLAPLRIIDTTKSPSTRLNYAYLGDLSPYPTATSGTKICIVIAKCIDHSYVSCLRLY